MSEGRMSVRQKKLFSRSASLWRRHLPGLMLTRLISILCHLMAAAPLLLVLYPPLEAGALCVLPLYWIMIPALRHNHAEMLMDLPATDVYLPLHLVTGEKYWRKLLSALGDQLLRLVSLIPLAGCIAYALQLYYGTTDSFTVLRNLSSVMENGDWLDGLMNRFGVVLLSLVPYVLARAMTSWRIYGRAIGAGHGFLRGSRIRLFLVWLCSLLAYAPFAVIAGSAVADYAASCGQSIIRLLMNGGELPSMTGLMAAVAVGLVVTQPLCMLRQVLLSTFVHDIAVMKEAAAHDAA